jgi:hypothetical protein
MNLKAGQASRLPGLRFAWVIRRFRVGWRGGAGKTPALLSRWLRSGAGRFLASLVLLVVLSAGCATPKARPFVLVAKWERFERAFDSAYGYPNPVQNVSLEATFKSPSGEVHKVQGFWDGDHTWRVRFAPNEVGRWAYSTVCSDPANSGLHGQSGTFVVTAARGRNRFEQHGPVRVSRDGHYLQHEDGTPFFWLSDTAWNGALRSIPEEWHYYVRDRAQQRFSVVQWVATQWRAAPDGDVMKELAFTGTNRIEINPRFFQRLDGKADALNRAGLLNAPVLLWAVGSGSNPRVDPGFALPEDQAILLARYMVARWGANQVAWVLGGDCDYRGPKAERWKRIGRAVFGDSPNAPVLLHPGGMQWYLDDFRSEKWLNVIGYQSGHGDDDRTLRWIFNGPPSTDWKEEPYRPFINLEPPYENHLAYQSRRPHLPEHVRRAIYWSLLNAPTAGVSYGGHGVWGWDDGTGPPTDHPGSGTPLPWREALEMPAANQMTHLASFFNSIEFWRLRPAPGILARQPDNDSAGLHIAAARSEDGDLMVIYAPSARLVSVKASALPPAPIVRWFNPRNGERSSAIAVVNDNVIDFATPGTGDWILLIKTEEK